MKLVDTFKVVFMAGLLGVALTGCERPAPDKAATGSPGMPPPPASSGASGRSSSAGSAIDDSIITTKVKTALLADADVKGSDINVETRQGEVMLSGFVNSKTQVARAVKLAGAVEGVKKVTDKTAVK
jgi:hyperosmotically inducible periplasmic protein